MTTTIAQDSGSIAGKSLQDESIQKALSLQNLKKRLGPGKDMDKELRKAAEGFESVFIQKIWKQMRDSVPKEGYLHGKNEEMYLSMFDQHVAQKMTEAGGIGLADMLYKQLKENTLDASRHTKPSEARESGKAVPIKSLKQYNPNVLNMSPKDNPAASADIRRSAASYTPIEKGNGLYTTVEGYEVAGGLDAKEQGQGVAGYQPPKDAPVSDPAKMEDTWDKVDVRIGLKQSETLPLDSSAAAKKSPYISAEQVTGLGSSADQPRKQKFEPSVRTSFEEKPQRLSVDKTEAGQKEQAEHSVRRPGTQEDVSAFFSSVQKSDYKPSKEAFLAGEESQNVVQETKSIKPSVSFGLSDAEKTSKLVASSADAAKIESDSKLESTDKTQEVDKTKNGALPPMNWPVQGNITSSFGFRKNPFTGKRTFHSGIDLAANHGDPVSACWDGKVVFSGKQKGFGNLVVLEHANGWKSYYGHNSKNTVKVGETVEAGKNIAKVGSTGRSTGPHVHFEVRQNGLAWDPKKVQERLNAGLSIGKDA